MSFSYKEIIDDFRLSESIDKLYLKERLREERHDALVDPVAEHGVALAAAGLPVGEQRGVEAVPGVVEHAPPQVAEHLGLVRVLRALNVKVAVFSKPSVVSIQII